ncbi:threonine-phosphate decarboxylase CobD [Pseudomonas sp. RIT-PI-S]|uniref:threonine-phosphate decarboxylase CobD n=1 Tax=Pseudomonas sp. RIT-PI-S TaxID=3035295 RepID=UPI0021DA4430|nr:threonine-phosphate decarboxylase CobD [Pseudomonas sp. RIT-PI-S]
MLEHGGRLRAAAQEFGIDEAAWVDLSTGIAPWPWTIPAIPERAWARLPEPDDGLEAAACRYYGAEQSLPVAGSQAAIQLLPRLRRSGKVGVLGPCYAEHAEAWRRGGHVVRELADDEAESYLDGLDVLVVVNPNNPTGRLVSAETLLAWQARLAARGGWLVVDEAFMDMTPAHSLASETNRPGLIVLRSFGKFFGLAGVRLGFVLAEPRLLVALAEQLGPWAVSGPTRSLGRACLQDGPGHRRQIERCTAAAAQLAALLAEHGWAPAGGCALFQWVRSERAAALYLYLAQRGILVRLFRHTGSLRFGLPAEDRQWQRLGEALAGFPEEA